MLKQSLSLVPIRRDLYQAKLVFYLFIASLSMFFIASLMTYYLVRVQSFRPIEQSYESLAIPWSFWASTGLLLLVSLFLQRASWMVHRERQIEFRRWLLWGWATAIVFIFIQAIGLQELLTHHFTQSDGSTKIYGMSFTLSLIHVLHVAGGIIFLGYIITQAFRNRYDHERHWAVDHCAGYWHFLDVVWIMMLALFMITG